MGGNTEEVIVVLKGKVALVTGAARGLGKAIAMELAQEGVNVAVNDYLLPDEAGETAAQIRAKGVRSEVYLADVSDQKAVCRMVQKIKNDFDTIGILINNAGISPKHNGSKHCVYEMDPEEWQRVISVNLHGVFYCTRYVAPIMIENRWGRIVNLSSMAGRVYNSIPGIHYCASKAAVIGFTRVSAAELAPFNIIVNAVAPGRIESEMMKAYGEERNKAILDAIPLHKHGTAEDVARTVKFLVSEQNGYVVGATIDVNGGWAML
jgi:3-oxoacyl-[acyl-carrier protein] reductase